MRNRTYQNAWTKRKEMESAGQILGRVLLDAQAHMSRNRRPTRAKRTPLQGVQLDLFSVTDVSQARVENPEDQPLLDLFPGAYE